VPLTATNWLTIAGDGPDRAELERRLAPLGDRVEIRGNVPCREMGAAYRQHDVLVLVSEYEGTSNSLLEAMAEGLVPVVTRTDSGVDLLEDEVDSRIVAVGAMDAMAGAIAALARDREALAGAGARAQAKAAEHTIEGNVRGLETVFDRVLQQPARSWPSGRPTYPRLPAYDGVFVPRPLRRLRQWVRRRLDIG
jgi:glycosyltransferase involved in cell wall biosynthesis